MNEFTLTQLKIIVERAVRPVQASFSRKRKMREELLAHVSGVFAEETARLTDDTAALERTALRFGHPADVTSQLQASVPASDSITRYFEIRPGESMLRSTVRCVSYSVAFALPVLVAVFFATASDESWSLSELMILMPWLYRMPFVIGAVALMMCWIGHLIRTAQPDAYTQHTGMLKSMTSIPAVRRAMIKGVLGLFSLFMVIYALEHWPTRFGSSELWALLAESVPAMAFKAVLAIAAAWIFVKLIDDRRRHHEEWLSLPIES